MFETTRGIVLKSIRHKEKNYILQVYTQNHGRLTFILHGVSTKKKNKLSYLSMLQPLTFVEIAFNYKTNKEIQVIKEIHCPQPYQSVPFDIKKSSIALFISEVLVKCLHEEEMNPKLYKFLEISFSSLDTSIDDTVNFHLLFVFKLTRYLGFYPTNNFDNIHRFFNLKKGEFVDIYNVSSCLNDIYSVYFNNLFTLSINDVHKIKLTKTEKYKLLESLMKYYTIHLYNMNNIKSLPVLLDVFS